MARLLLLGTAAGPLFITVWLIQALTRDGFDPTRHPMSLLSLGAGGWVQIANFVVVGLLLIGFALGVRRALHPGRADIWGRSCSPPTESGWSLPACSSPTRGRGSRPALP